MTTVFLDVPPGPKARHWTWSIKLLQDFFSSRNSYDDIVVMAHLIQSGIRKTAVVHPVMSLKAEFHCQETSRPLVTPPEPQPLLTLENYAAFTVIPSL